MDHLQVKDEKQIIFVGSAADHALPFLFPACFAGDLNITRPAEFAEALRPLSLSRDDRQYAFEQCLFDQFVTRLHRQIIKIIDVNKSNYKTLVISQTVRNRMKSQASILVMVLLCLGHLVWGQQYPTCPGGVPADIGNQTSTYSSQMLVLTDFISQVQDELYTAFSTFLTTGSNQLVNEMLNKNKSFYIILTILLILLSLVLFIILIRMGDLQLTDKDGFQKLKEKGFSSPLSAFFALTAFTLLITTVYSAYLIPVMIKNLEDTECRLDNLNQVFLDGSPQYNWDGVRAFSTKLEKASNISKSFDGVVGTSYVSQLNQTNETLVALRALYSQYNSFKSQYSNATIAFSPTNNSQNIDLAILIPNLFANDSTSTPSIFNQLEEFIAMLDAAFTSFMDIQHFINASYLYLNSTASLLAIQKETIKAEQSDYFINYAAFRFALTDFFKGSLYILVVCEVITGVTVVGSLISLFSMRMIQSNYDYFSLKVYKVIWACHIIVFCMNLVFLMVFNQIVIYSEGSCLLADSLINNQTEINNLLPQTRANSGTYLFTSCLFQYNFTKVTQTSNLLYAPFSLLRLNDELKAKYSYSSFGKYTQLTKDIEDKLLPYKFGVRGNYSKVNELLAKINEITYQDSLHQNCFKHNWAADISQCSQSDIQIIVRPTVPFSFIGALTFQQRSSVCFLMNDYTARFPGNLNIQDFFTLYQNFISICPSSLSSLQTPARQYFTAQSRRQEVINNLISELGKLQPYFFNVSNRLVDYTLLRTAMLAQTFTGMSTTPTYSSLFDGNSCEVVRAYTNGVYNEFCINFRANAHQVYLIVICNLGYCVFLIFLSFLYAIELQSTSLKNDEQFSERVHFHKMSNYSLSDSFHPSNSSSENRSELSSQKISHDAKQGYHHAQK